MSDMRKLMEAVSDETVEEGSKPDFLDLDGDGDKDESMKKAADDKEKGEVKENMFKVPHEKMSEMELPDNSDVVPPGVDEMGLPDNSDVVPPGVEGEGAVMEDDGIDLLNGAYTAIGSAKDALRRASNARNIAGNKLDPFIEDLERISNGIEAIYFKEA